MSEHEPLKLFVYGTLRRGGRYHDRFCNGAVGVEPATVTGRLYDLEDGYPALEVPPETILASGTHDPVADIAEGRRWHGAAPVPPEQYSEQWDTVQGEVLTLSNPAESLPRIDRLEDFEPDRHTNLYRRVLVLANGNNEHVPAWTYIGNPEHLRSGRRIAEGVWRP